MFRPRCIDSFVKYRVCLESDEESIAIDPPGTVEFGVKAEREGPTDGDDELSIEVELEWPENATDTTLSIE